MLVVSPDGTLDDCLQVMEESEVRRVPVVDKAGRCVGIVSQADVARIAPASQTAELLRDVSRKTPGPCCVEVTESSVSPWSLSS
jgi:CBS domain-containing protein